MPVVCLTGPRQSGKTTLVRALMPDSPCFSLDHGPYLNAAKTDPTGFVAALPRRVTICEIQRVPELLPAIKLARTPARARQWHRQYVRSIVDRDVLDVGRVRDADGVARLLRLLAVRNGELLNTAGLSRELGLHRSTVREYIAVLERLFLVRRLPAWHRNVGKRLIRRPKMHMVDSGLAATLAGLGPDDWLRRRDRMRHLLESFVTHQLIAQSGWTDPDLRFWHFRDKDGREVDLVMTLGARTWGIEVKATSTPGRSAGRGMARLAALCGDDFAGGILLYNGRDVLPLADDRMLAVPLGELWER